MKRQRFVPRRQGGKRGSAYCSLRSIVFSLLVVTTIYSVAYLQMMQTPIGSDTGPTHHSLTEALRVSTATMAHLFMPGDDVLNLSGDDDSDDDSDEGSSNSGSNEESSGSSDASHEAVEETTDRKNTEISGDRANSVDQEFDNKERKLFVTPKEDKPAKISGRPDGKMNILFMVSSLENNLFRLSLWH